MRGDAFTAEQKARNFDYYERITVRDSSLSACIQAVIAAEVGHLELAFDYAAEATLMDLGTSSTTSATDCTSPRWRGPGSPRSPASAGMRDHDGTLSFKPRLPSRITRLGFRLGFHGRRLEVEVSHRQARYTVLEGAPLEITHHGTAVTVAPDAPETCPIPEPPSLEAPTQPKGRAPARRGDAVQSASGG